MGIGYSGAINVTLAFWYIKVVVFVHDVQHICQRAMVPLLSCVA